MVGKVSSLLVVGLLFLLACEPKVSPSPTPESPSPTPESGAPQFGESRQLLEISIPSPFLDIAGFPLLLSVSPDGQRIAYRRPVEGGRFQETSGLVYVAYEYFVANRDGSEERMLGPSGNLVPLAWSPDGSLLAIAGGEPGLGGALRLGVVGRSGEEVRWLVTIAEERERISGYQPIGWAPDSRALYYSRLTPGRPAEFWSVDMDTGNRRKILTTPAVSLDPVLVLSPRAVLSPDGQHITFLWPEDDQTKQGWWLVRADGTGLSLLRAEEPKPGSTFPMGPLSWSPDGRGLAYPSLIAATEAATGRPFMALFYARLDDPSHPVLLASGDVVDFYAAAAFSPDSRWAAFNLNGELWVANTQTGRRQRLTTREEGRAGMPFWLPSGDIIYEVQHPEKRALFLLPALRR